MSPYSLLLYSCSQNAFTDFDYMCPIVKTVGMLGIIITFYDLCQKTIADSPADAKLTYAHIKTALAPTIQKLVEVKYITPTLPDAEIKRQCQEVEDEINREFQILCDGM